MESENKRSGVEALVYDARGLQLAPDHVKRDDLISLLLQDRNTLRMISAPHGFGKTSLAQEYATRLFSGETVVWVDASKPDFLLSLDNAAHGGFFEGAGVPSLIIIDDLPWLHEQRADTLSRRIDAALYAGSEILLTTLPSCDCLATLQADRLLVRADDLLAHESECVPARGSAADAESRALAMKKWEESERTLCGRVPSVIWGNDKTSQRSCLVGLFAEKLPAPLLQAMFSMLMLGQGSLDELERLGMRLKGEDRVLLLRDYPLFGIDSMSGTFLTKSFALDDLKDAIVANRLEPLMFEGAPSLSERALGLIFDRGSSQRGSKALGVFCNDEQCASWLIERGWGLFDRGELGLVATLLERTPEYAYVKSRDLQALHAWLSGFSGDRLEARHLAEHVLASHKAPDDSDTLPDKAGVAARLACAMFDDNAIVARNKSRFATRMGPVDALDFLACAMDICTNAEIARAFYFEGPEDDKRYEQSRHAPTKQRQRALVTLFTDHYARFKDTREFKLALHLLAHVDSRRLRRLVQELGCDSIVEMRRSGVNTFIDAVLVRDMWNNGYFGLVGPVMDRRDAKILDGASHMLNQLARSCGFETPLVPWESHSMALEGEGKRPKVLLADAKHESMYVRLFGGLEVTIGETYIGESKWRKKARALFSLLVLNQGRDVPRDYLFEQIWPELSRVHALDNFYTIWSNCSSVIGEGPYIERNGEYCRIDPRFVHSDVAEFEQLTRHLLTSDCDSNYLLDTYAKIEVLYRGGLLPSENDVSAINAQRDRYCALFVDSMVAATDCALRMGDMRIALWFARKAMEEDQYREDVYRALMKAQIASGQRCPAIKTYLKCCEFLRSTLGLDPSAETRELYETLVTTDPGLLRLDSSSFANDGKGLDAWI